MNASNTIRVALGALTVVTTIGMSATTATIHAQQAKESAPVVPKGYNPAPPRRIPKDEAPHAPQRPGASQTTHRTTPDEARSMPPHAAHAAGAPHARHTCAAGRCPLR